MPVSEAVRRDREARYQARWNAARAVVPVGSHCYTITGVTTREDGMPVIATKVCPYWKYRGDQPDKRTGYCRLLRAGDATQGRDARGNPRGTFLLWDQCKECGINDPDPEDACADDAATG